MASAGTLNPVGAYSSCTGRPPSGTDTEADELCVIIAGEATVEFLEPQLPAVQLRAGSVLQLSEGMQTRWTVHSEQLRKVYLAP